ncbi:hypothetical protein EMEDMD4_270106 [Sinorhizobium medicae]|uniref:Uncharacterized protein n=1 Tax=Sinorhizobium medicae TaxID=110321 RepID=A0A508WUW0_9HYPH|nr:hypothetical protein EMEDMD4_270106 [Sinorhizobium medicae]
MGVRGMSHSLVIGHRIKTDP